MPEEVVETARIVTDPRLSQLAWQEALVGVPKIHLGSTEPYMVVNSSTIEAMPETIIETLSAIHALHDPFAVEDQYFQWSAIDPLAAALAIVPDVTDQVLDEPGFGREYSEEGADETGTIPKSIVESWHLLATSGLSEESYLSLLKLASKKPGWRGKGSRSLDYRSLGSFLRFWKSVKAESVEPEFVLIPNGNLQAEWYRNNRHFVELEFRTDDKCLFGVFDGATVFEGRASVKSIVELLAAGDFGPLKWSNGG